MAAGDVVKVIGSADSEIGKITAFSHESADTEKYLGCDGSTVSRTTYSKLFAKIGELYGAGDGSTTFNLPDFRGQFLRGFDDGRGIDTGRVFGSNQLDELKEHSHTYGFNTSTDYVNNYPTGQAGTASINVATGLYGGPETRPKNVAVKFYIRYEG